MSKKIYIAKLSGGKDSTAMVDLLLRNNYPLDYILFCDTLAEFSAMYEYLDKLDAYFKKAYDKSITRTKPMITDFKMSERDCQAYLKERELENPLYRHFTRTGCAFCPAQSMRAKFNLWKHYPSEWQKIKELESEILAQEAKGEKIYNKYWFNKWSVDELETRFEAQDDGCGSLFDDEPLKDCFCKF